MLVDINQWRAATGSFKALTSKSERFCIQNPFAMLLLIFQLYLPAFCFTLISTTILPLTITIFSLLWYRRLVLLYKFINSTTSDYTHVPIPALHLSKYSLRTQPSVGQIWTRTEKFKSSFYPNSLLEWNRLDPEIRESPSLSTFRKRLLL